MDEIIEMLEERHTPLEIGINFDDYIEGGVFYHALASDVTWFVHSNFGLKSDF